MIDKERPVHLEGSPLHDEKMTIIDPILTVRDLSAVFPDSNGGLRALEGASFEVCPQEFVCVLGPSGSGKSTILRILAGLLPPTSGEVTFSDGEQPKIGMVFQEANLCPGARCSRT